MPDDALETVLRLVADGRLSADEAGPILDRIVAAGPHEDAAMGLKAPTPPGTPPIHHPDRPAGATTGRGRALRLEVNEGGRSVVKLRVPLSLGKAVLGQVPGLSATTVQQIRDALDAGVTGPILDVAESGGDSVRVLIEE